MLEASLLDDARFLEELAKIEALPMEDTRVLPRPVPTMIYLISRSLCQGRAAGITSCRDSP